MMIKKINVFRKSVFLGLTQGMGGQVRSLSNDPIDASKIKKILVIRPNHRLGNLLLVTALIKELENTFPDAKIDILTKGSLAKIIYKNYDSIEYFYQLPKKPFKHPIKYLSIYFSIKKKPYDLAINAVSNSSSGRIFTAISQAKIKITDCEINVITNPIKPVPDDYKHLAKQRIYQLRSSVQ